MLLAPIIFGTIVVGIARMGNLKEVGRVGVKALIYFEIVSTLALAIGLVVVNVLKPGAGNEHGRLARWTPTAIATYTTAAKQQGVVSFFMNIIPSSVADAFVQGQHAADHSDFGPVRSGVGAASRPGKSDRGCD